MCMYIWLFNPTMCETMKRYIVDGYNKAHLHYALYMYVYICIVKCIRFISICVLQHVLNIEHVYMCMHV